MLPITLLQHSCIRINAICQMNIVFLVIANEYLYKSYKNYFNLALYSSLFNISNAF